MQAQVLESATALNTRMETCGKRCVAKRQLLNTLAWFTMYDPEEEDLLGATTLATMPVLKAETGNSILKRQSCLIKRLPFKDYDHIGNAV